jgi:CRISPR-associated protein Cmr3
MPLARNHIHLRAGLITGDGWRTPGGVVDGLAGHVVSACIGKPVLIGGWDSLKRAPKALEPYLPVGSTLFMQASESELQTITQQQRKHIGEKTNWGYGQVLIGRWQA